MGIILINFWLFGFFEGISGGGGGDNKSDLRCCKVSNWTFIAPWMDILKDVKGIQ